MAAAADEVKEYNSSCGCKMDKEPIHLTVGPGTPVRVHVSKRDISNVQALTQSLHSAQYGARSGASSYLKAKGQEYLDQMSHDRAVDRARAAAGKARATSSSTAGSDTASKAKSRSVKAASGAAQKKLSSSSKDKFKPGRKAPFYPPPNKTHGKSYQPSRSLKQVGGLLISTCRDVTNTMHEMYVPIVLSPVRTFASCFALFVV
eukprot:m.175433 g.175433  ORF g.175433 m.175433 type:complete len:204 (-) comp14613_c0_seq3:2252-2863(-)